MEMKKTTHRIQAGFTLMELIVSLGIIGFLVLVLVQTFISTVRANTKTEALREIKQNGDYAIVTMTRMIQSAASITTPAGTHTSLSIVNNDGTATTFDAVSDGTVCRIRRTTAGTPQYLTSGNVHVDSPGCQINFTVMNLYGTTPANVKFVFTLTQKPTAVSNIDKASMQFQSSTQLRNVDF